MGIISFINAFFALFGCFLFLYLTSLSYRRLRDGHNGMTLPMFWQYFSGGMLLLNQASFFVVFDYAIKTNAEFYTAFFLTFKVVNICILAVFDMALLSLIISMWQYNSMPIKRETRTRSQLFNAINYEELGQRKVSEQFRTGEVKIDTGKFTLPKSKDDTQI